MLAQRMRWPVLLVLALAAVLLVAMAAMPPRAGLAAELAEPPKDTARDRSISVLGDATIDVVPDRAVVSLGVNVTAATAGESYAKASDVMNRIVGSLMLLGIMPTDVQTAQLSLHEERKYNPRTGEEGEVFYRTTSQLRVITKNLNGLGKLVDAALEAGANSLQGIQFTVLDTEKYLNEALDKATDDAKTKAARVATRLGAELGAARRVSVQLGQSGPVPPPPMPRPMLSQAGADRGMPVLSGTVPFQVTVSAEFELR